MQTMLKLSNKILQVASCNVLAYTTLQGRTAQQERGSKYICTQLRWEYLHNCDFTQLESHAQLLHTEYYRIGLNIKWE